MSKKTLKKASPARDYKPEIPMPEPNVISFSAAAADKEVERSTLYRAADRGELNVTSVGSLRMIFRDEKYRAWQSQRSDSKSPEPQGADG